MDFDVSKYIPAAAAVGAIWLLYTARRAYKQAKQQAYVVMKDGLVQTDAIEMAATPQQITQARQELEGKKIKYMTHLKVPKTTADNLLEVKSELDKVLALPGVYFNPSFRMKLLTVRGSLARGQHHFSNTQTYALGRSLRLGDRMKTLRDLAKK